MCYNLYCKSKLFTDLQEKVLVHVQNMYYESSLTEKCEIIRTFKILITNLVHKTVDYFVITLFNQVLFYFT